MLSIKNFYLISLPIGNLEDISIRALRLLKESEAIIVENFKTAKKQLDLLKIDSSNKTFFLLNVKGEKRKEDLISELMFKYTTVSLISDAGAPVFADPGHDLVKKLIEYKIPFTFVPGANSLIAALVLSGFQSNQFFYAGFLTQKKEQRKNELKRHLYHRTVIAFFETPYRLDTFLQEMAKVFPTGIKVAIAFSLTTSQEFIFRGRLDEACKKYTKTTKDKNKLPFVLLVDNRNLDNRHR